VDFTTGISGKASGIAATDQGAKDLYEAFRGMLGIAKAMTDTKSVSMQRLYDGLRVTQDGKVVNLYIEEQEDSVATMMDLLSEIAGRGGRRRPVDPNAPRPLR
jgi:hypothetical protein